MEITELLNQFEISTGKFPRAAVEEAVARQEEITPELLRILEDTIVRAKELGAVDHYMAHMYAMYLLAQFRETRAYPLVVRIASLPEAILDSLCGDFIVGPLDQVLASVSGGDPAGIKSIIENEDAYEYARSAALRSLLVLVANGQQSRDETVSYFAHLFRGKLARRDSLVWNALVSRSCDLYPEELNADIEQAFQDDLVDPNRAGDVKYQMAIGKSQTLAELVQDERWRFIEDTVSEFGSWACFESDPRIRAKAKPKRTAIPQTKSSPPKIGRNERCPCGSGKKYKKCCGA